MKTRYLIIISALALVALIAIQGYLVFNTFQLKKRSIDVEARTTVATIYNNPKVDSLLWIYRNSFLEDIVSYKNKQLSKSEVLTNLKMSAAETDNLFCKIYKEKIEKTKFDMDLIKVLTDIRITDSLNNVEEFFTSNETSPFLLIGKQFNLDEGTLINSSVWQKDHEYNTKNGLDYFNLNFKSSIYMRINNYSSLIFIELLFIFFGSILLLSFAVGVLVYSILNLMKQKKIARIKSDFINNITHELKTPLSTLSLATHTLSKKNSFIADKDNIEIISIIDRQNKRLQKIFDQVLESSVTFNEIELEKENVLLDKFFNQIISDFKITLNDDVSLHNNLNFNIDDHVLIDSFHMSTVIINILNNAVKYGASSIIIENSFNKKQNLHTIAIRDNGIGISVRTQKFIFSKFYRVPEKYNHQYKGLGLGLYYVNQIMMAHNGTVSVKSELGTGSTFFINIPKEK